jgi:hypothetical protein
VSDYVPIPDGMTPDCIALWDCEMCLNQSLIRLTIRLNGDHYACANCASWWSPELFTDMIQEVDALTGTFLADDCLECGGGNVHWECDSCEIMTTTCPCDPVVGVEGEPCPECGRLMVPMEGPDGSN